MYIKELSKLSGVPLRTLHYYDSIGLLKASLRGSNNYRLYSEEDLLKLQRIVALKFFGFSLAKIKILLTENMSISVHFAAQSEILRKKASELIKVNETLEELIQDFSDNKSVPWKIIIKSIEVYHMTEKLENTWAGKVMTPEELKEYAEFEHNLKTNYTEKDKVQFETSWADLIKIVNKNLSLDPAGSVGIKIAEKVMHLISLMYGREHTTLRKTIWEKGFKGGHFNKDTGMTEESVAWLDKAMFAYYKSRIYNILAGIGIESDEVVLKSWDSIIDELCGDSSELKSEVLGAVMSDSKISDEAKVWVKKIHNTKQA